MKRLTTLTGKNLPRLAVAKPGWPEPTACEYCERGFPIYDNGKHLAPPATWVQCQKALSDFTRVCDQTGLSEKKKPAKRLN